VAQHQLSTSFATKPNLASVTSSNLNRKSSMDETLIQCISFDKVFGLGVHVIQISIPQFEDLK
jgi:hypothetical protein